MSEWVNEWGLLKIFLQTAKVKCQLSELFASSETNGTITTSFTKTPVIQNKVVAHLNAWSMLTSCHVTDKISQDESGVTFHQCFQVFHMKFINKAIDLTLREEQAGFRSGRGCMHQIFALQNILEKSLEWNTSLCINFIDFQRAFDSVQWERQWKIIQAYGLPPKIINLINMFYNNFECSIILGNTITEAFPVKSGVRQGCILSPILFLIKINWVLRQAISLPSCGILWTIFSHLHDLDFPDDITILSSTPTHL